MPGTKFDPDMARTLTKLQRDELAACEAKIEAGLRTFYEVGTALARIKSEGLYKEYGTFDQYCAEKWDMTGSRAYQHIDAAKVVDVLKDASASTVVEIDVFPVAESQVRDLVPLLKKQGKVRSIWRRAIELAGGKVPSAAKVALAKAEAFPKPLKPAPPVMQPVELDQSELGERPLADQVLGGRTVGEDKPEVKAPPIKPVVDPVHRAAQPPPGGLAHLRDYTSQGQLIDALKRELPVFKAWYVSEHRQLEADNMELETRLGRADARIGELEREIEEHGSLPSRSDYDYADDGSQLIRD